MESCTQVSHSLLNSGNAFKKRLGMENLKIDGKELSVILLNVGLW